MKFFRKKEKQPETAENQQPKVKNTLLQTYFTSLLSLVLCVGMFFGTSYAWFTSEVTNMGNEIYIGILDVELEKQSGSEWLSLSAKSNQASINHLFSEEIHWEPGYTALETIRITNKGELDFRYVLNFTDGTTSLADSASGRTLLGLASVAQYFDVWVYAHPAAASTESTASPAPEASAEPAFTKPDSYDEITKRDSGWVNAGTLADLLNGKTVLNGVMNDVTDNGPVHTYTIALHMREDATSNVMGHKITLNVKLVAYQLSSETDAFENANYDNYIGASNAADLHEALNEHNPKVLLASDITVNDVNARPIMNGGVLDGNGNIITYSGGKIEDAAVGVLNINGGTIRNLTIIGGTDGGAFYSTELASDLYVANCNLNGAYAFNLNSSSTEKQYTITFVDTIFNAQTSYTNAMKHAYFTGCKFTGTIWPAGDTTFTNCTIAADMLNLSALAPNATITLLNCEYGGTTYDKIIITKTGTGYSIADSVPLNVNKNGILVPVTN